MLAFAGTKVQVRVLSRAPNNSPTPSTAVRRILKNPAETRGFLLPTVRRRP